MNASRIATLFLAGLCSLSLGAQAVEPAAKPAAAKPAVAAKPAAKTPAKAGAKGNAKADAKAAPKEVPAEVLTAMNKLVEVAIQRAAEDLSKGVDEFKPYAVLQLKSGELKNVHWNVPNPPPPFEMLRGIVLTVRKNTQQNPDIVAAVTVAPSEVPTKEGVRVKGIRCEVDHRDGEPRVVFIPYTREEGKLVTGSNLYLPGTNPLFLRPGDAAATPATPAAAATPATPATPETPAAAAKKP